MPPGPGMPNPFGMPGLPPPPPGLQGMAPFPMGGFPPMGLMGPPSMTICI